MKAHTLCITTCQLKTTLYKFTETSQHIIDTISANSESNIIVFHELIFGYNYDDLFLQPDLGTRGKERIYNDSTKLLNSLCGSNIDSFNVSIDFSKVNNFYVSTLRALKLILDSGCTLNKILILSCPMQHEKKLYNCNVVISNNKIVLVRPKTELANECHYHEPRQFSYYEYLLPSGDMKDLETIVFPILAGLNQINAPFGVAILEIPFLGSSFKLSFEICEELWCEYPTIGDHMRNNNVDILINTSSSYFEYGKLETRINLISNASKDMVYVYCNNCGEQGITNTCMDGGSMVFQDEKCLTLMKQFQTEKILTSTVYVDLSRNIINIANDSPKFHIIVLDLTYVTCDQNLTQCIPPIIDNSDAQCLNAMMCWLWGYYANSRATYLFLPLSGGLDSANTSVIVFGMCKNIITKAFMNNNVDVLNVIIPRLNNTNYLTDSKCKMLQDVMNCYTYSSSGTKQVCDPVTIVSDIHLIHMLAQQICSKIHITAYLGSEHSSLETWTRARNLSLDTGAHFISEKIQNEFVALTTSLSYIPKFGVSKTEDLALECIQARLRMLKIYTLCQTFAISNGYNSNCFGLVLASSNASELFVGYWTKYDAGSADLCLIGGCGKTLIKKLAILAITEFNLPALNDIVEAVPTAELKPIDEHQTDEDDIGFTYEMCDLFSSFTASSHVDFIDIFNLMMQLYDQSYEKLNVTKNEFINLLLTKMKKYIWRSFANIHKRIIATNSLHIERADPDYKRACLMPNNIDPSIIINELECLASSYKN
jgi:NAD+ synthase (glutamine-hydrolysing)